MAFIKILTHVYSNNIIYTVSVSAKDAYSGTKLRYITQLLWGQSIPLPDNGHVLTPTDTARNQKAPRQRWFAPPMQVSLHDPSLSALAKSFLQGWVSYAIAGAVGKAI